MYVFVANISNLLLQFNWLLCLVESWNLGPYPHVPSLKSGTRKDHETMENMLVNEDSTCGIIIDATE